MTGERDAAPEGVLDTTSHAAAGRGIHRSSRVVLTILLGGVAAWGALFLVPASHHEIGPTTISVHAGFGSGRTELQIPPLGTVSASTHGAPLTITLSLLEIDIPELGPAVSSARGRSRLASEMEEGLRSMAAQEALRLSLGGIVLGGLVGALLPFRRWNYVLAGAGGGMTTVVALVLISGSTFDVTAFEEPTFTGSLTRAPVVIDALRERQITLSEIQSRYETAADRLTGLLALVAEPDVDPRGESVAILHVSDIHSNPVGVEITRQLAEQFQVDAILDTGDLTNFGLPVEASIGTLIETIRAPYYLVPGNHDSARNERALALIDNITVINREVVEITGLRVLGWADPTDTNWNAIPPEEAAEIRIQEGAEVALAVEELQPDILAVHDRRMAEASIGDVPLIVSGHYHERALEEREGTLLLAVGSTGATGVTAFTVEGERDYEAEIVYFREARPVAIDYVRFSGLGSDFEVSRRTLPLSEEDEDEDEDVVEGTPGEEARAPRPDRAAGGRVPSA